MQIVLRLFRDPPTRTSRAGFTLIELIVSLFVISVATTIFMKLYATSMDLGKLSRNRQIATSIAEEQLGLIMKDPARYVWEKDTADDAGFFRVRASADDPRAGVEATLPTSTLPDERAFQRETTVYNQFRWSAFGHLGTRGLVYEVTVDVSWEQAGKRESVALTGAVSRGKIEPNWTEAPR